MHSIVYEATISVAKISQCINPSAEMKSYNIQINLLITLEIFHHEFTPLMVQLS